MCKRFFLILLFTSSLHVYAQELNCRITVNSDQIQGTDKRVFDALRTAIFEFMNNRKWTTDAFKTEERIDCNILLNITERLSNEDFKGTLQIQARRPVYKSSYNSVLFNYDDKEFEFKYLESQPLEFNDNTFSSNLTQVLAFYAYYIIGLDYDSFSLKGGTPYLQKALTVVNNSLNASERGWKPFESNRNRYWMINNLLDAAFIPLRECMYNYHRNGLDLMASNRDVGRTNILQSIESLNKVFQAKPLSFNMQIFFNAKADEVINIFSGAFPDEKAKVITTLNEIDPTNSNKYQRIMNTQ
jgi:Domain of unknown function (DUF4835)